MSWFSCRAVFPLLQRNSGQEICCSIRFLSIDCHSLANDETSSAPIEKAQTKVLKVAFIGRPNVGKSTLINQIVGRTTCAVSMKAHTTRVQVKAACNENNTQLVFLDTPGLVSPNEVTKYKFDSHFLRSAEEAIQEADVLGIIHDASYTKVTRLDPMLVRLLLLYQEKSSFLLLNKVDSVKKDSLLHLAKLLTQKPKHPIIDSNGLTEQVAANESQKILSWPYFSEVFMISALKGDGVGDVKEYLLQAAKPGKWLISGNKILKPEVLAVDLVKAACLDYLPDEVPYKLVCKLVYFEDYDDKSAVEVAIFPANNRHGRMVLDKIRFIAAYAESHLASALEKECRLRIAVKNPADVN